MNQVLKVANLSRTFGKGSKALNDVTLFVEKGEMVALVGASGSGKSTLLRHIAGLIVGDKGAGGNIEVLGRQVQTAGRLAKDIRRTRSGIGFIFQQFNIVGRLSVIDNVLTGMLGRVPKWRGTVGYYYRDERVEAMEALVRVGLAELADQRASTLSGGQQQRVAIARTLAQKAELILADEPIASLDPESARRVMDLLASFNRENGKTVIVSLHQVDYARRYCQRVLALKDGSLHHDGVVIDLTVKFLKELYGSDNIPGIREYSASSAGPGRSSPDIPQPTPVAVNM